MENIDSAMVTKENAWLVAGPALYYFNSIKPSITTLPALFLGD
jgi:hypothetical protein